MKRGYMEDSTASSTSCPYLKYVEADLQARSEWVRKDSAIMRRRLGERPSKRNKPYPGAPNTVDPLIDDLTREKTDQEISMILNAPEIAIFIPVGEVEPEIATMAQKGFNTYLRHLCDYRARKEESVDTKNCRGFSITKLITENHPEWGMIPSFETVDPRDLIVPPKTKKIAKAERLTYIGRPSLRELKNRPEERGWSKKSVDALVAKLKPSNIDDAGVTESSHDDQSVFKVTKQLIGLNTSDLKNDEIVIWETCKYADQWDADRSNDLVKKGEKCVTWICPDVPDILLHIVRWKEEDDVQPLPEEMVQGELELAMLEGREPVLYTTIPGKDKEWGYVQHRYEYRSRLWYDSRGIGHTCMDNQIIATNVQNAKLIQIDFFSKPMFEGGNNANQQNVVVKPGAVLPDGIKHVQLQPLGSELSFEADYQRRTASKRSGSGGGTYSAEVSQSRKLQKTATEVQSEDSRGNEISSASVERFNDADRELFPMLWRELKRMQVELPMIGSGMSFDGMMPLEVYNYRFLIVPAASDKSLNPDLQFRKDMAVMEVNIEQAPVTGADIAAGMKYITGNVNPNLAHELYPDPNSGELPITTTLMQIQQAVEQIQQQVEQNTETIEAVRELGGAVADEMVK